MALTDCEMDLSALPTPPMDDEPWQVRLQAVGWDQKMLAKHLGLAGNTVSSQLRGKYRIGVPRYIKAVIIALERMTAEERQTWADAVERENDTAS